MAKETYEDVPLMWITPVTNVSFNHPALQCLQIALDLSAGGVLSTFNIQLDAQDMWIFIPRICEVLIHACSSVATGALYRRISKLLDYMYSISTKGLHRHYEI
jgi:hypothetical protein